MQLAPSPYDMHGLAEWRRAAAGVLAKARRVDPAELPAEPERLLDVTTYDGLTVAPLYTRADERPEQPLPGVFPFVRGGDPRRDVHRGWHVVADIAAPDGATANDEILTGLANGVSAIRLATPAATLPAALSGVLFELAPVMLNLGRGLPAGANALYMILDDYACDDRAAITVSLGAAPLTSRFGGRADVDVETSVRLAGQAVARAETVRAITVDGSAFHDAGASDAQELGAAVAAGLEYLRALVDAGMSTEVALGQLEFCFAASDDQFQTIAKFRAARRLWARVGQVCGAPSAGVAPQHAVTSRAMMTRRDPWVNLLRGTLAAFGAGVGGADSVVVLPFDAALPPGALGVSKTFADRMARNTQLLLLEESHLGRVLDPAAGSWYVDDLTDRMADKAWEFMQQLEQAGGYSIALETGMLAERIGNTRAEREADVAHRRTTITGVNEFPNLNEPTTPAGDASSAEVARYGAGFEALRDRADRYVAAHSERPAVRLVRLGPVAEHNARVTFAANLLAAGGIEAVDDAGSPIAVLCGSDKRYAAEAAATVTALRAEGVTTILLAGSEKAAPDAGLDGFLTMRIDAIAALSDLLGKLGA